MERADRTHREEFHDVTDAEPELEAWRAAFLDREWVYDHVRPTRRSAT